MLTDGQTRSQTDATENNATLASMPLGMLIFENFISRYENFNTRD